MAGSVWWRFGGALAVGVIALAINFWALEWAVHKHSDWPLSFAVSSMGIIFFLGVLMLGHSEGEFTIASVRHAIAAGFVVTYLTLFGLMIWHGPYASSTFGNQLLGNFTDLMQIILPFYFVSEGVIQLQKARAANREADSASSETENK